MKTKNRYKILRFKRLASTNDYAKEKKPFGKNLLIIADMQLGGRGTKGRGFSSTRGGVYLTALTFYQNFPSNKAFEIMQNTALAVCETLAEFGLTPKIKWPNDIFVGGRKICGILIENTFLGEQVANSIVGVGLNVNNELPAELEEIATTIKKEKGKKISLPKVRRLLIKKLCNNNNAQDIAEKYVKYLGWLGEEAFLLVGDQKIKGRLITVDETGALIAETKVGVQKFSSAEVSLRF